MNERDKEKLETLYAGLPSELRSPSVILAVIELVIALKKLYDLIKDRDKARLFAEAPTTAEPLTWTVLGGEEEKQEEKEEE